MKKIKLQLDPRIDEILHGETEGKYLLLSNTGDSLKNIDLKWLKCRCTDFVN